MNWLTISITVNIALLFFIALYLAIYSKNIREAKLSTFSMALQALSYGVAVTDNDERYRRLSFILSHMLNNADKQLVEELLRQSAIFGYLSSKDPSLIDLLSEPGRLVAVRSAEKHGVSAREVDEMWQYVLRALSLEDGYIEPAQRYGGEGLKKGQIFSEARLINLYEQALKKAA